MAHVKVRANDVKNDPRGGDTGSPVRGYAEHAGQFMHCTVLSSKAVVTFKPNKKKQKVRDPAHTVPLNGCAQK